MNRRRRAGRASSVSKPLDLSLTFACAKIGQDDQSEVGNLFHLQSRRLVAADLGIADNAVERLAGRISVQGRQMTVRIENVRIFENMQGQYSVPGVMNKLLATARGGGMHGLVIEGVGVGNARLAKILVERYGAIFTPQRTLSITLPL